VWGYTKSKEIERLHLKFLKRFLNRNQSTCNAFIYGELGRYKFGVNRPKQTKVIERKLWKGLSATLININTPLLI